MLLCALQRIVQFCLEKQPGLPAEGPPLDTQIHQGLCQDRAACSVERFWGWPSAQESGLNIKITETSQGIVSLLFKKTTTPCTSLTHNSHVCIFKTKLSRPQISFYFLLISSRNKNSHKYFQQRNKDWGCSVRILAKANTSQAEQGSSRLPLTLFLFLPAPGGKCAKYHTPGLVPFIWDTEQCLKIRTRHLWVSSHEFLSKKQKYNW